MSVRLRDLKCPHCGGQDFLWEIHHPGIARCVGCSFSTKLTLQQQGLLGRLGVVDKVAPLRWPPHEFLERLSGDIGFAVSRGQSELHLSDSFSEVTQSKGNTLIFELQSGERWEIKARLLDAEERENGV